MADGEKDSRLTEIGQWAAAALVLMICVVMLLLLMWVVVLIGEQIGESLSR